MDPVSALADLFARDRFRKKLVKHLSKAEDEGFLKLIWVVDAYQSDRRAEIPRGFDIPLEARNADLESPYAIYKWELETLANLLLSTPKDIERAGLVRKLRTDRFQSISAVTNILRSLENAEAANELDETNILNEMHRIGHRQFPWQRGFFNRIALYRYSYIYNNKACGDYFESQFGISMNKFILCGFACYGFFSGKMQMRGHPEVPAIGISSQDFERYFRLSAQTISDARRSVDVLWRDARKIHGGKFATAYMPSVLRERPIILDPDRGTYMAPLPELVALRMTAGVYYDIANGPSDLRNEVSSRFEMYCRMLLGKMLAGISVDGQYKYSIGKRVLDSPDIFVRDAGRLRLVIECKATKMTFAAQFGEDPYEEARHKYEEIAKGVFQIWRYMSHLRLGYTEAEVDKAKVRGFVLTLDKWLAMSIDLQSSVLERANEMAAGDRNIEEVDRIGVLFGSVDDLENLLLHVSGADELFSVLEQASDDRFLGWLLPNIRKELVAGKSEVRDYPFDLGDVLPWWSEIDERGRLRQLPG